MAGSCMSAPAGRELLLPGKKYLCKLILKMLALVGFLDFVKSMKALKKTKPPPLVLFNSKVVAFV